MTRRGVYAVGHAGLSSRGRWKAATLALGANAVLSHQSAAELWGMLRERHGYPHVTVPGTADRPRRDRIVTHRSTTLTRRDNTIKDGIPVTTPGRTLEDLPQILEPKLVRAACRQAEFDRLPLGTDHRTDRTRSELERDLLRLFRRHRLPPPEVNASLGAYTVDFLWRPQRLIVEVDGYQSHSGRQAFTDDRVRDARLAVDGYRVQRFADWQLEHEPLALVETVRVLLAR